VHNKISLALFGALCYNITQGLAFVIVRMQAKALADFGTLGLVVGLPNFALVLGSTFWGVLADKWKNRRSVVVLCSIISAILYLPLPWLGPMGLVIIRTIQSFFLGGMVQISTLFSELDPKARATLMGRLESVLGLGWGVGAFVGGFLIISEDYGSANSSIIFSFILTGSIATFAVVGYMGVTERSVERKELDADFTPYFWKLFRLFATSFVLFMGYMFFLSFSPVYLTEITKTSLGMGVIVLLSGIVHALIAPYAGVLVDRYPRHIGVRIACFFVLISMLIYSTTKNVYLITAAFVLPIFMLYFLVARSIIADIVPYQLRARAMGLLSSFTLLGGGLGSILAGHLLLYFSYQEVFFVGSFLAFIAVIIGWLPYQKAPSYS